MALAPTSIVEINNTATANNVNGGGFNPANANMLTDLATTNGTSATPTVTSATYTFVAGDVGNWLYVKSGTNWIAGWYQITGVSSGAQLSAAVGAGVKTDSEVGNFSPRYLATTAQGCCTQDTPGGNGTFAIDYSQSTACITSTSVSDYASAISSTTMTSATAAFTPVMVGNFFHLNNAGTGGFGLIGWYELVSYTNATTVVTDRTTNNGTAMVAGQGKVGGALSFNSTLDDDALEISVATNGSGGFRWFTKTGFTVGETINVAAAGGSQALIAIEGYQTLRGDSPSGANRPTVNQGANAITLGTSWAVLNLIFTGTADNMLLLGTSDTAENIKVTCTSTTAGRTSFRPGSSNFLLNIEAVSYRGRAMLSAGTILTAEGLYLHDSDIGIGNASSGADGFYSDVIVADNVTAGVTFTTNVTGATFFRNLTLFGAENKLGTGLNFVTGTTRMRLMNSIIYGFVTGVAHADVQNIGYDDYNNFYNNTTDISDTTKWHKGAHDIALNPGFADVTQITGTGATSSTNVLTGASGTPFSTCEANVDFVYLSAGTGTGIALVKYLITAVNAGGANITVSSNITSSGSGSNISWQVTTGHDFSVGTNMKAAAFPGAFPGL